VRWIVDAREPNCARHLSVDAGGGSRHHLAGGHDDATDREYDDLHGLLEPRNGIHAVPSG
jgi:hypothetical protein